MSEAKRVLVYGLTGTKGGIESFVLTYYKNFDKEKIQYDFISFFDKLAYEDEIKALGGKVYKFTSRNKNPIKNFIELNKFFKANANKYIAVHLHICDFTNITVLNLAKKYNIPIRIIHAHIDVYSGKGIKLFLHNLNYKKLIRNATDYFACSGSAGKFLLGDNLNNNKRYRLVKNAVDTQKYTFDQGLREKIRAKLNLENKFVLGHVGRFHFQKNHLFLIKVLNELYKRDKNICLLLIGEGDLFDNVKSYVNELGIQDAVKFMGPRNDVSDLMQAMDLFILPSLYEGLPIVGIEAQCNGLPCLFSSNVTNELKVNDNVFYFDINDNIDLWVNKILELKDVGRHHGIDEILKQGYDIKHQSKALQDFYLNYK